MQQLLDLGFTKVGHWTLDKNTPIFKLNKHEDANNLLYAFVVNKEIKYLGKTTQQLKRRMYGYQNPGPTQSTNININEKIKNGLFAGKSIDIYILLDDGRFDYGGYKVNIAAGLEDNLISSLNPHWNKRGSKPYTKINIQEENEKTPKPLENSSQVQSKSGSYPIFNLVLHKTYFDKGFFNVPRDYDIYVGNDKSIIKIQLDSFKIIQGKINRTANTNGTARIMGTAALRDWFQSNFEIKDTVNVDFISKNHIRLR